MLTERIGNVEELRQKAFADFIKTGLPKSRSEDWKYIDFSQYNFNQFSTILKKEPSKEVLVHLENIKQMLLGEGNLYNSDYPQIWMQYNGYNVENSMETFRSLKPLQQDVTNPISKHYKNGLSALNQALLTEGCYLIIPKNTIIDKPIYIINVTNATDKATMVHTKTQIIAEENSCATVIEVNICQGLKPSFTNAVTEIDLCFKAQLNHILIQQGHSEGLLFSDSQINQAGGSLYQGTTIALGGQLNRSTCQINLNEPLAHSEYSTLAFGDKNEQIDIHLTIDHRKPYCHSQTLGRGVMAKRAKGAFSGKIIVCEGAIKTQAALETKNLLLSLDAEAYTRPLLEIYNDDIQCSHGATVGHLDLDALFYLKSRGIPEKEAKQMLVDGFIYPSLKNLPSSVFKYLEDLIHGY